MSEQSKASERAAQLSQKQINELAAVNISIGQDMQSSLQNLEKSQRDS